MTNAVAVAERATSDLLSAPDWAINVDIIKADPWQGKEALKIIKKKLRDKNPNMQILALFILDALSKSCGAYIFHQMIEGDILRDLVKIVKEKPDLNVREKIVAMIDSWQTALGGIRVKFPQYYEAYNELKSADVEFPPRVGNNLPWFTPPPMHLHSYSTDASGLSLEEIKTAERITNVLTKMLAALAPNNSQGVKDKLIVDLVARCRAYQKLVTVHVNNTVDEGLLCWGLQLYDRLQRVLLLHDNIASAASSVARLSLFKNVNHEDEKADGDSFKLTHRSSKYTSQGLVRKPAAAKTRLKPTGSSKGPFSFGALFTRIYGPPEEMEEPLIKSSTPHSSSPAADPTVKNHLNGVPAAGNLPPLPSRYNQRQQFFKKHITGGLFFKQHTKTEQEKPRGSMYKYAIDLAKAKTAEAKAMTSMYKFAIDLFNAEAAEAKAMTSMYKYAIDLANAKAAEAKAMTSMYKYMFYCLYVNC